MTEIIKSKAAVAWASNQPLIKVRNWCNATGRRVRLRIRHHSPLAVCLLMPSRSRAMILKVSSRSTRHEGGWHSWNPSARWEWLVSLLAIMWFRLHAGMPVSVKSANRAKTNLCQKIRRNARQGLDGLIGTAAFIRIGKPIFHYMGCSTPFSEYNRIARNFIGRK